MSVFKHWVQTQELWCLGDIEERQHQSPFPIHDFNTPALHPLIKSLNSENLSGEWVFTYEERTELTGVTSLYSVTLGISADTCENS